MGTCAGMKGEGVTSLPGTCEDSYTQGSIRKEGDASTGLQGWRRVYQVGKERKQISGSWNNMPKGNKVGENRVCAGNGLKPYQSTDGVRG